MSAPVTPVREWVGPDDYDLYPSAVAAYLTAEVGGDWDSDETCAWLNPTWLPGVTLTVSVGCLSADSYGDGWQFGAQHEATRPDDIARFLRRQDDVRAWLLSGLHGALALVGGAP